MTMRDSLEPIRLSVDMAAILAYADITDDFNPLHVDPVFAASTPMGGVIAHGTMSANLILQSIVATFGRAATRGLTLDIRFAKPVRIGDALEAGGQPEAETGTWRVWVRNQDGVAVIEGTATLPRAG